MGAVFRSSKGVPKQNLKWIIEILTSVDGIALVIDKANVTALISLALSAGETEEWLKIVHCLS